MNCRLTDRTLHSATIYMLGCAILFAPHEFGQYLEFVEWDTLLFFALLFVLVETLSELGLYIRSY